MGGRRDRQFVTGALGLLVGALGGCGLPTFLPNFAQAEHYLVPPTLVPLTGRQVLMQSGADDLGFINGLIGSAAEAAKGRNAPGAVAALQSALDRLHSADLPPALANDQSRLTTLRQAIALAIQSLQNPVRPDELQIIDGLIRHVQALAGKDIAKS